MRQQRAVAGRLVCALALAMMAASCTSDPADPQTPPSTASTASQVGGTPTSTSSTMTITSSSTSTSTSTASSSTSETVPAEASALPLPADAATIQAANPQEVADRAAIEVIWRRAWDVIEQINEIPVDQRKSQVDELMVDPLRSQILQSATQFDAEGKTFYGSSTLHPYWYHSVDGQPYAVIGDCRDASGFGSMVRATEEKLSAGDAASNTVGQFVLTSDGWKLWNITFVTDVACTVE